MESTRMSKVSRLLQKELAEFFQRNSGVYFAGSLVSVTVVRTSPDFSHAKAYISIFPKDKAKMVLDNINLNAKQIKHDLAQKVKHQLRKMPDLEFFPDDSLDYAAHIDDLLKK